MKFLLIVSGLWLILHGVLAISNIVPVKPFVAGLALVCVGIINITNSIRM